MVKQSPLVCATIRKGFIFHCLRLALEINPWLEKVAKFVVHLQIVLRLTCRIINFSNVRDTPGHNALVTGN